MTAKLNLKIIFFLFITFIFSSSLATKLSKQEKKHLDQITKYLNSIKNLKTHFIQIDEYGNSQKGVIYLSRPGKMRWDYTSPKEISIFFDNKDMIHYDKKLDQVSYFCSRNEFINFLTQDKIDFNTPNLQLNGIKQKDQLISLSLKKEDSSTRMTLFFAQNPIALYKLTLIDESDDKIQILFSDLEQPHTIPKSLFTFTDHKYNR